MDLITETAAAAQRSGFKGQTYTDEIPQGARVWVTGTTSGEIRLVDHVNLSAIRRMDDLLPSKTVTKTIGQLIGDSNPLIRLGAVASTNVVFGVGNQHWAVEESLGNGVWVDPDGLDTDLSETEIRTGDREYSLKTLALHAILSRKFMKCSAIDVNAWMQNLMARLVARDITTAALVGTGALQPTGIRQTTGVIGVSLPATPTGMDYYGAAVDAMADLEAEKADLLSPGIVACPTVKQALRQAQVSKDLGSNGWIHDSSSPTGERFMGLPALSLKQMPAGEMCIGDFGRVHLLHGDRISYNIVDTNSNNTHYLYCHHDADVLIEHPTFAWLKPSAA